jgi:hypothetical protein
MNEQRRAGASATAGAAALALAGFFLACGGSKAAGELGPPEPSWLVPCAASSECAIGECLCGVCTEPCAADVGDCSGAPAGASCFASGSVGHAAACGDSDTPGVCLPGCRAGDDCGDGFACTLGACVPAASLPESTAAGDAVSRAYADVAPSSWLGVSLPDAVEPSRACDDPMRCPTLEALLRTDSCFEVLRGCGITYLNAHDGRRGSSQHYWYDGFEAPPLLAYDRDSGELLGSGGVECDAIEMACWTCDAIPTPRPTELGGVRCAQVPGVWPGPPPAPAEVPGCACEPDASGGARVSLDCFCGIYGCPSQAELLPGCAWSDPARPEIAMARLDHAALDASEQLWLSNARYAGQRYAFDVASGALVGAVAFSQGPATLPCNAASVSAGRAPQGEPIDICYCVGDRAGCSEVAWFPPPP